MKNRITSLTVLVVSILISNSAYSQRDYRPGYIVDIHGDTINGLIDYRNWGKNPEIVTFKKQPDLQEMNFSPADIRSFSVENDRYISATVTIDESPVRDNELLEHDTGMYRTVTKFLMNLVDGNKSLYVLVDNNSKIHFFIGHDESFESLIFRKYREIYGYGAQNIKTKDTFKGQLIYYFQDYPELRQEINNLIYTKNDLIKLFDDYYKHTPNKISYKYQSKRVKPEIGLFCGVTYTKLKFVGTYSYTPVINTHYSISEKVTFGGFYNFFIQRTMKRLSICNEIMYTSYNTSGQYRDTPDNDIYTVTFTSFRYSYFGMNNLIRYSYPVKNFSLFIDAGFSNRLLLSFQNHTRVDYHVFSMNNISEKQLVTDFKHYENGVDLGAGCKFRHLLCEFRYERSNGMIDISSANLGAKVRRCFAIIGYRF